MHMIQRRNNINMTATKGNLLPPEAVYVWKYPENCPYEWSISLREMTLKHLKTKELTS